jgi:hypothetical protein
MCACCVSVFVSVCVCVCVSVSVSCLDVSECNVGVVCYVWDLDGLCGGRSKISFKLHSVPCWVLLFSCRRYYCFSDVHTY